MKNIKLSIAVLILSVVNMSHSFAEQNTVTKGSLKNSFSSWGKPSLEGDWKIIENNGKLFIDLGQNFRAKEGPDVKIFLSPTTSDELNGGNATHGSVLVQQITSFRGKSRIEVPKGIDISQYQSLVFHCEAYSKIWGTSSLK